MKKTVLAVILICNTIITYSQPLHWVKKLGAAGFDSGEFAKADAAGNVYVTGKNASVFFMSKLDANGNYLFNKNISTILNSATDVDASGNIYITGQFQGTVDFDPDAGVTSLTSQPSPYYPYIASDVYVAKYDNAGSFIWAKSFGQEYADVVNGITVDALGDVYVTGEFVGTVDFNPGAGSNTLTASGNNNHDAYVLKLANNGDYLWAQKMGGIGTQYDMGESITTDANNNVYIAGLYSQAGTFFNGTTNISLPVLQAYPAFFAVKFNSAGTFIWAKCLGGTVKTIKVDALENVYYGATLSGTISINTGVGTPTLVSSGFDDFYISKLSNSGDFIWAKQFGGASSHDNIQCIAIDGANIYATGRYAGLVDFDPNATTYTLTTPGNIHSSFIARLDSAGNFLSAVSLGNGGGGSGDEDTGYFISTDNTGNIYTTGTFRGTGDFFGTYLGAQGGTDGYLIKNNSAITGLNNNQNSVNSSILIYPNPSQNIFNVSSSVNINKIEVTDVLGKLIFSSQPKSISETINFTNEKRGIYFVKITSENNLSITKKIIIN